jgi:hypothetical protein
VTERPAAPSQHISVRDRRMLAAAYWPIVVFAGVLIIARISRTCRQQLNGGQR